MLFKLVAFLLLLASILSGAAQTAAQGKAARPKPVQTDGTAPKKRAAKPLDPRKKFVLDVVQTAVSIPQSDPQDRLRVLNSAAGVVLPISRKLSKQFASEGVRIEAELIAAGVTPVASLLASGYADCAAARDFVERLPAESVVAAEQSLIGAITACPKTVPTAQQKLELALEKGVVAARPLLAVIERLGAKNVWSQQQFERMISSLPSEPNTARQEAPNYAAMYARMAPEVDEDVARSTGLKLLVWLGKLEQSGERNLAVNIGTDAMKAALGEKKYNEALATDVMARQVAQSAGQAGEIDRPEEESASVLKAIDSAGTDRTEELAKMPSSLRAREAAASGFATGTSGNSKMADRYFDIAFAAADEVWASRAQSGDAPAVIEEVSEAAAHVNAVNALQRAQKLEDPTAQAVGMLAVARVVAGSGDTPVASR